MKRTWIFLGGLTALASGCLTILGGGIDFNGTTGGSGGATSTTTTSTRTMATGGGATTGTTTGTTTTATTTTVCDAGTCTPPMAACGGCSCADTTTDAHNCGRCGHDCLSGACSGGVCQAWPVYGDATIGTGLGADGKYVAWDDNSSPQAIHTIPVEGDAGVTTFTQTELSALSGVALNGGIVAFISDTNVYTAPESQNMATARAPFNLGTTQMMALTVDSTGASAFLLHATTASPQQYLMQCTLPSVGHGNCVDQGTGPVVTSSMAGPASNLLVNGTYAFWVNNAVGNNVISRYDFSTQTVAAAPVAVAFVTGLAIDQTNLYWTNVVGTTTTIYSLPQAFSTSTMSHTVATVSLNAPSLATDGSYVYVGTKDPSGNATLSYVPVGGGSLIPMFTSPSTNSQEYHLVVAGGAVFWADGNVGSGVANIMGIATP